MSEDFITECPECGKAITLDMDSDVGDMACCPACDTEFEIASLDPITLKPLDVEGPEYGSDEDEGSQAGFMDYKYDGENGWE